MNTATSRKTLDQFYLLGSNVAKLTWRKVGPISQQKTIEVLTLAMMDELAFPSSIRSEFETFLGKELDIKQLAEEVPEVKSLLGLYIGNSIGHQQMQAFYLGYNIINLMPMCEMASIEIETPSLKGAISAFDHLLSEFIEEARELSLDTSILDRLYEQSRTAKTGNTFDKIRLELIECGQIFAEELKKRNIKPFEFDETKKISILFLAADPTDTCRLRLGKEFQEIQDQLKMARLRDRFRLELPQLSVQPAILSQVLLDMQPQVVHFSGHGTSAGALCFENQVGQTHFIQPDALAALFEQFAGQVNCVVLNACYSEIQASAIVKHIGYVIGMNQAISDKAAIAFDVGFYQALGSGRSIEDAYQLGCVQIRLQGIPEHLTPVLNKKR